MADHNDGTYKLIEEIKIYWTVQTLAAPAIGFLLSRYDFNSNSIPQDLANIVYCLLTIIPLIIGVSYNIAGAGYILECRIMAGLGAGSDLLCHWLQLGYIIVSFILGILFTNALLELGGAPRVQVAMSVLLIVAVVIGVTVWAGFKILFIVIGVVIGGVCAEILFHHPLSATTTGILPLLCMAFGGLGTAFGAHLIAKHTYGKLAGC